MSFRVDSSDWYKPKRYSHFDYRVTKADRHIVQQFVINPEKVKSHAFYPFITFAKKKYKTQINGDGTKYLSKKGQRGLCYSAHLDSQIFSYYAHLLSEKYEQILADNNLSDSVIAFRSLTCANSGDSKCNIHLAKDAFEEIKKVKNCDVYAFDVEKFFDSLDKRHLKKSWARVIGVKELPGDHYNLFKFITSHVVVNKEQLWEVLKIPKNRNTQPTRLCSPEVFRELAKMEVTSSDGTKKPLITHKKSGIPQGSSISAILANIYMLDFDIVIGEEVAKQGGKYFRYCDDILCILPADTSLNVEELVSEEISKIFLKLNSSKTEKSIYREVSGELNCDRPIQYLGFVFTGKSIAIRPQSVSRFRRNAKRRISNAKKSQGKVNLVRAAQGESLVPLRRKKLIEGLTHHGESNFISYGHRAALIMKSTTIKGQLKKLDDFVFQLMDS